MGINPHTELEVVMRVKFGGRCLNCLMEARSIR